jgi:cytochrome c553
MRYLYLAIALSASAQPRAAFQRDVLPFLEKRCVMCHNEKLKNADLNLARLRNPDEALRERNVWEDVLEKVRNNEMPPPAMPRPSQKELLALSAWIDAQIARVDASATPEPGHVTARRLNKVEYNNTIADLFGVAFQPADDFPNDDSGYGFDNIGDVLSLSPVLMEKYLSAAERVANLAIVTNKPGKATLNRYPSDKAAPDPSPGAITVKHWFPAWAEYEIHVRMIDRRRDGPPVRLALLIDGEVVTTASFQPVQNGPNRLIRHTMALTPGAHAVRGIFVDDQEKPVSSADPLYAKKGAGDLSARDIFVDYIEVRGPFEKKDLPITDAQRRIMICAEPTPACVERIVGNLLPRVWRRDVAPGEIAKVAAFGARALKQGETLERAAQYAIQAMLVSPHFLFRIEKPSRPGEVHAISEFELASRLSYFLWSSTPDETLLAAARNGQLRSSIDTQIKRMLADPRSAALADNFAGQWLQLRNLESHKPDPEKFPQFDESLRDAMVRETRTFFETIIREDRSILEFLDSDYTFLNERLAQHYGIDGIKGEEFRRVALTDNARGGVLSHASVLTISSYPTRTSPVLRGKWIMENLLGTPPPPPPANVPELNEAEVGNTGTLRTQLEKHRANATCAVCHNKMDALGFGLENFDPVGKWRTMDGKFPVDSAGALPGNKTFKTPAEMRALLKADPKGFTRCLTEKLLTYSLGRGLEKFDRPTVSKICNKLAADNYRMSTLILAIAESLPFQYAK